VFRESAYFKALQTALHGAGVPYGYAVSVWSTGSALVGEHGVPATLEMYLFAVGATTAYGGLRLLTWETGGEADKPLTKSPHLFRAGVVHLVAIGAAITCALLLAQIDSFVAWPLASFIATALYLGISSIEVATVERDDGKSGSGE
jgi:hypothetical protein